MLLTYVEHFFHENDVESRQDNDIASLSKALELQANDDEFSPTGVANKDFGVVEPHGGGA